MNTSWIQETSPISIYRGEDPIADDAQILYQDRNQVFNRYKQSKILESR
jgi:hypothetical protein